MSYKILSFFACLAVAPAASIPEQVDLREAFETEDAIYIPISIEEAKKLRLPKSASILELPESSLAYIPDAEKGEIKEPASYHDRVRRDVGQVLEIEDAYYVPVSDEEAELLRLPSIDDLALSEDGEAHVEIVADHTVQRAKRQLNIQGGGSPHSGFDLSFKGQTKLWESNNKRNTLHGTGQYSQHFGGPYGNSRPNFGGGLIFTHRF
ncbi:unnamed protein product [Hermetia illucens]|uniref:Attacin C-terminal domain-containing protein n=2 Tax=Hermetia illucens TaxID=343691 RepID=A0A7R8UIJ9_HERIL|nr:unnamed protein product [Hermetia illucens]